MFNQLWNRVCLTLCILTLLSACGDDDQKDTQINDQFIPQSCKIEVNDCPNQCESGIGVIGEVCDSTTSCACGLFCDEGYCQPYRGEFAGCLCNGVPGPQIPPFAEVCTRDTEGSPCNDLNTCTERDRCQNGICLGQAVTYAAACDDGNSCTANDVCAGAVCQGSEKADGSVCDDRNLCSVGDVCLAGVCQGSEMDCSASFDQCNLGACNPNSGTCMQVPSVSGTPCNDENACTLNDRCETGVCVGGSQVDCSDLETQCSTATCDPSNGQCQREVKPDGLYCETDDSLCTQESCQGGRCVTESIVRCNLLCRDGICNPETGRCDGNHLADGTACDDGNECTENNQCVNGQCEITANLCTCEQAEAGHTCDLVSPEVRDQFLNNECVVAQCNDEGQCIPQTTLDGTECNDNNVCTINDACNGRSCVGNAVDCSTINTDEIGECQELYCNPNASTLEDACIIRNKPNNIVCEGDYVCASESRCQEGICIPHVDRDCSLELELSTCQEAYCDPNATVENACQVRNRRGPCSTGDVCAGASECDQGECVLVDNDDIATDLCEKCIGKVEGESCTSGDGCLVQDSETCQFRGSNLVCKGTRRMCHSETTGVCQVNICHGPERKCAEETDNPESHFINLANGTQCATGNDCHIHGQCNAGQCESTSLISRTCQNENSTLYVCETVNLHQRASDAQRLDMREQSDKVIMARFTEGETQDWYVLSSREEHKVLTVSLIEERDPNDAQSCEFQPYMNHDIRFEVYYINHANALHSYAEQLRRPVVDHRQRFLLPRAGDYLLKVMPNNSPVQDMHYGVQISLTEAIACTPDGMDESFCCNEQYCSLTNEGHVCADNFIPEVEPNNVHQTATRTVISEVTQSSKTRGELVSPSDEDWYRVELKAYHSYRFMTSSYCGASLDTELSLFEVYEDMSEPTLIEQSSQRATVSFDSLERTHADIGFFMAEDNKDYWLRVRHNSSTGDAGFGHYILNIEDISCSLDRNSTEDSCTCVDQVCTSARTIADMPLNEDVGVCLPILREDESNNNSIEELRTEPATLHFNQRIYGKLSSIDDQDIYHIQVNSNGPYHYTFTTAQYCNQEAVNTQLKLFDLQGRMIASDTDSAGNSLAAIHGIELTSGQYFLEVSGQASAIGEYIVYMESEDDPNIPVDIECTEDADCGCIDLICENANTSESQCVARASESEPNTEIRDANMISIDQRLSASLSNFSDVDLFAIDITADDLNKVFEIETISQCNQNSPDTYIELLDMQMNRIEYDDNSGTDELSKLTDLTLYSAGRYYIRVGSTVPSRGAYVLQWKDISPENYITPTERSCSVDLDCMCDDLRCTTNTDFETLCTPRFDNETEPNNSDTQASALTFNQSGMAKIHGHIHQVGDVDYYSFNVEGADIGKAVYIATDRFCNPPNDPKLNLVVFTPEGIASAQASNNALNRLATIEHFIPTQIGVHVIEVRADDNYTGEYVLEVDRNRSCDSSCTYPELTCENHQCVNQSTRLTTEIEPNGSLTNSQSFHDNQQVQGYINHLGDKDVYHIEVNHDSNFKVTDLLQLEVLSYCETPRPAIKVEVRNPLGEVFILNAQNQISTSSDHHTDAQQDLYQQARFRLNLPGEYKFVVDLDHETLQAPNNTAASLGAYILNISKVSCEEDSCWSHDLEEMNQVCNNPGYYQAYVIHDENLDLIKTEIGPTLPNENDREANVEYLLPNQISKKALALPDHGLLQNTVKIQDSLPNTSYKLRFTFEALCEADLPLLNWTLMKEDSEGSLNEILNHEYQEIVTFNEDTQQTYISKEISFEITEPGLGSYRLLTTGVSNSHYFMSTQLEEIP